MLNAAQIHDLQSVVDPPAVTLLLSNDRSDRAGRLDALFAEVESRLSLELDPADVMDRIRQLVELAETVDEDRDSARSRSSPAPTTAPPRGFRSPSRTAWWSTTPSPRGTSFGHGSAHRPTWSWSWPIPELVCSWARVGCCGRWLTGGSRSG